MTAYSIEPSTAESSTWPAVRTTNMSPRPWSKMISAATRLSAHPNTTAVGFWPSARLARCCDALAGVLRGTGDEAVVTLAECLPCSSSGFVVRHGHIVPGASADGRRGRTPALVSTVRSGTCRGDGRVSRRGRSWSASSCCSRPPSRGSSRSGATGSPAGRRRRPPPPRARPTSCGRGGSSATRVGPSGCTSARP